MIVWGHCKCDVKLNAYLKLKPNLSVKSKAPSEIGRKYDTISNEIRILRPTGNHGMNFHQELCHEILPFTLCQRVLYCFHS